MRDGITLRTDPFPSEEDMAALMAAAWGADHDPSQSWAPILSRSLAHVAAYREERLVGFVNVAWDGGVHAFLLDTSVHPDEGRQGVGTALVTEATSVARAKGAHWLHVDFPPHLAGFYMSCGFRISLAGLIALKPAAASGEPSS